MFYLDTVYCVFQLSLRGRTLRSSQSFDLKMSLKGVAQRVGVDLGRREQVSSGKETFRLGKTGLVWENLRFLPIFEGGHLEEEQDLVCVVPREKI